ncbi:MAG: tRNA preQ1(34) S-adenosylmethionine ribosyltransferase-isomerase QueA [Candidatus Binatia bacterium]
MLLSDFDYELPLELIAQEPEAERSRSRLLYIDRCSGQLSHLQFPDIVRLLPADCVLVLNDTRVFPARLRGYKSSGGRIELLLLHRRPGEDEIWEVMCKGGQGVRRGARVNFSRELSGMWIEAPSGGRGIIRFFPRGDFQTVLERVGEVPLPPYIKRAGGTRREDRDRYQTVYARHSGAVAAPTAGLHFTPELLSAVQSRGIELVYLTLHVGVGTFQPVRTEHISLHKMEEESYVITPEGAQRIQEAKRVGRKVIAVGTTTTRALESAWTNDGQVKSGSYRTNLFIYPGFVFHAIDGLITNFHLPRSTLLMLVSAFVGRDRLLNAYREAVNLRYRFYSYGDAMLIL